MSNYVTEFCSKYVSILLKTNLGNYTDNGAEYHNLIDAYEQLYDSIKIGANINAILNKKSTFEKEFSVVQDNVSKAWNTVFKNKVYPSQRSIHGLNIIINVILEKIAYAEDPIDSEDIL